MSSQDGFQFALSIGADFFETSALSRLNVEEAIDCAVRLTRNSFAEKLAAVGDIKHHKKPTPIPKLPQMTLPNPSSLYDSILSMVNNKRYADVQLVSDDWEKFKVCQLRWRFPLICSFC